MLLKITHLANHQTDKWYNYGITFDIHDEHKNKNITRSYYPCCNAISSSSSLCRRRERISCKNLTAVCPAGQTGSVLLSYAAAGGAFSDCKEVQKAVNSGQINPWTNKFAQITGGSCSAITPPVVTPPVVTPPVVTPPAPSYISTQANYQNLSCPPSQPSGSIVQQQTYELWTDGPRNYSGWNTISDTCVAVKNQTIPETRGLACAAGQVGSITQNRTYELWSDGSVRNITAWTVTNNTCAYPPFTANPTQRPELCPVGYTGSIRYKWVVYYTSEQVTVRDAEGQPISYFVNTPHEQEVVDMNSCTLIPTHQTGTTTGFTTENCDSFYNVATGTYIGTMTKTYTYTTTYSSVTKEAVTTSQLISQDVSGCTQDPAKVFGYESSNQPCPTGQTGIITLTRMKATDSKVVVTYPNGTAWNETTNTCAGPAAADPVKAPEPAKKLSVISNSATVSDMFNSDDSTNKFVATMNDFVVSNENNKFNFIVSDLRTGKYNKANVSKAFKAYSQVAGANTSYNITLPSTLEKYVGNGALKDTKNKMMMSAVLNANNAVVLTYADRTDKRLFDDAEIVKVTIPIFDAPVAALVK